MVLFGSSESGGGLFCDAPELVCGVVDEVSEGAG